MKRLISPFVFSGLLLAQTPQPQQPRTAAKQETTPEDAQLDAARKENARLKKLAEIKRQQEENERLRKQIEAEQNPATAVPAKPLSEEERRAQEAANRAESLRLRQRVLVIDQQLHALNMQPPECRAPEPPKKQDDNGGKSPIKIHVPNALQKQASKLCNQGGVCVDPNAVANGDQKPKQAREDDRPVCPPGNGVTGRPLTAAEQQAVFQRQMQALQLEGEKAELEKKLHRLGMTPVPPTSPAPASSEPPRK
jgi:hypothetical protein